jgi:uncharacterized damage-inducible protein DinB
MSIAKSLIPEFDHEMASTRKALERLPEDKLEFKPDPKSMSLGRLAGHITEMIGWGGMTLQTESLDIAPGGKQEFAALTATSRKQVLAEFDKNAAGTRAALESATDENMMKEWKLMANGVVMISMPKVAVMRTMILNHIIHHRGQLTVYFRLTGVSVPALYGPSADEGQAATA